MSFDREKKSESYTEDVVAVGPIEDDSKLLADDIRRVAERKLVRKLDFRLMPAVAIIYFMNYMDRAAISSARLQGLEADLGLTDVQYDTVVAILYASYCPAQIPSNMILGYVNRPSLYISACVVAWGLTSVLTGITTNFAGIIACRVFIAPAAFYPGSMYLLSRWYTKKELAFRSAIFFVGLLVSNAFGSLIAAGILGNMQGKLGIAAWRWLFYIEASGTGAITMFVGLQATWILPDFPHNTRWLNAAERKLAQVRLAEDAGEADQDAANATIFDGFKLAIKDPKVLIFMLMSCSQLLGLSYINFFPTLTATLGFNTTITLLMSAPPWIFASICCLANAWNADRTGERFFHIAGWWWAVILGYIISLCTMSIAGRYFSLFLMTTGYCGYSLTLVWVSSAVPRPPAKRSVAIGLVNGFGNLGMLMGSYIWKANWSPKYHPSMIIALSALVFATFLSFTIRWMLIRENKQMDKDDMKFIQGPDRARIEEAARLEGITFDEAIRRRRGVRYLH
ncbi:major facilitator superfamily domain-containing protein [Hygrophoropsis aurantiaca]|uniref:Major facilitator superfamily domain-containing protein n=1 Tax=Hygrophoropsis aurantiaca TaxID=72124 RepID=A0ACB8A090_9AGAM|nr:major facilitator superfamily domain-containing protein [Hygrophoropsis aurantiaca]